MNKRTAFQGELMLSGWSDSHTGGSKVTFWLPDDADLDIFRMMTVKKGKTAGQRFMAVLVELGDDEKPVGDVDYFPPEAVAAAEAVEAAEVDEKKREPNELARSMMISGYFRNAKLWRAMETAGIYTQDEHKAWLWTLPCTLDALDSGRKEKGFPRFKAIMHTPCDGDVVCHHGQGAAVPSAGKGKRKAPDWFGVPLCATAHHNNWAHASNGATRQHKEAIVEHAVAMTAFRIKDKMKETLMLESLSEITDVMLTDFEVHVGLR
jgi:hypothetical protein